jgi:hypothetical protein
MSTSEGEQTLIDDAESPKCLMVKYGKHMLVVSNIFLFSITYMDII